VVFQLPPSCTQLHDCDTSLVGVGDPETIFFNTGRMVYCCWPEAIDGDLCQDDQLGRLILDNRGAAGGGPASKFVGTHKTIIVPGEGVLATFLYENAEIGELPEGTYGLIIANCNEDGRQIHVAGGVHWTPKRDTPHRGEEYHMLHEQYHDGGVRDHVDYQDNHNALTEYSETTTAPELVVLLVEEEEAAIVEEEETIDESVVLVPPGVDGEPTPTEEEDTPIDEIVQGVPPGADGETTTPTEVESINPGPDDEGIDTAESFLRGAPSSQDEDADQPGGGGGGGGGIGLIAAFAGSIMVLVAATVIITISIYYPKRRKKTSQQDYYVRPPKTKSSSPVGLERSYITLDCS
jgi:hypothetical protein